MTMSILELEAHIITAAKVRGQLYQLLRRAQREFAANWLVDGLKASLSALGERGEMDDRIVDRLVRTASVLDGRVYRCTVDQRSALLDAIVQMRFDGYVFPDDLRSVVFTDSSEHIALLGTPGFIELLQALETIRTHASLERSEGPDED